MVVYKTTNIVNGKVYIGKDSKNNPAYLGSGLYLQRAVKKYGKKNFIKDVLEVCSSEEQLNEKEKYWIKIFNSTDQNIGYNLTEGGTGGNTWKYTPDKKEKINKLHEGARAFRESENGKKFFRETMKARWSDPEFVTKMSETMRGRNVTWKDKISSSIAKHWEHRSRTITEETRKKLSESSRGREVVKVSNEHKKMILNLYNEFGPVKIRKALLAIGVDYSLFVIRGMLKKEGVYKKYAKGLK